MRSGSHLFLLMFFILGPLSLVDPVVAEDYGPAAIDTPSVAMTAFSGLCAFKLAMGELVQTDCSVSRKYQKRMYCFSSEEHLKEFMSDPEEYIVSARSKYAEIVNPPRHIER